MTNRQCAVADDELFTWDRLFLFMTDGNGKVV